MSEDVSSQFKRMLLNVCYSLMAGGITMSLNNCPLDKHALYRQ